MVGASYAHVAEETGFLDVDAAPVRLRFCLDAVLGRGSDDA